MATDNVARGMAGRALTSMEPASHYLQHGAPYIATPVAGRGVRPTGFNNLHNQTFQRIYRLHNDCSQIRLVYQNFAPQGSPNENAAGRFALKASVVWTPGSSATAVQVTFSGQRTIVIEPYQVVVSDPIDVAFGTVAGSYFGVRSYVTMDGAFLPTDEYNYNIGGYTEGYQVGDYTDGSNSFGGSTSTYGFGPVLITGNGSGLTSPAIFGAGDSIMAGTGWPFSNLSPNPPGFLGYFTTQNQIAFYNASRSGETIQTVLAYTTAGSAYRIARSHGFKHAVCQYGTNDIGAGRTLAQIKADMLAYWGYLARRGMRVRQTTITPRCASTDGFVTMGGQSLAGGAGQEAIRISLNAWLRAPASLGAGSSAMYDAAGTLTGVVDTTLKIEANSDGSAITINSNTGAIANGAGGYWIVDATAYDSGVSTTWTSGQKMNDTSKAWTIGQWYGYSNRITADAGAPGNVGAIKAIAANSATQLTSNTFSPTPSGGCSYEIRKVYTEDGIHPAYFGHIAMASAFSAEDYV